MLSTADKKASLTISQLSASINENLLFSQISLTLTAGQFLWVSGNNGSGKSTFLKIISGLTDVEHGQVLWYDKPIRNNKSYQQSRSYLAHQNGLKQHLTASENISFYLKLLNTDNYDIDQLLFRFGLLEHADSQCQFLSFGQQRRLALCRLIISQSTLWLLDEPFTGLDSSGRQLLTNLCIQHIKDDGIVVLSHHGSLPQDLDTHVHQRVDL